MNKRDYYSKLYQIRFSRFERIRRKKLWQIFCSSFLQQFINKNKDIVLDIGAGSCEFINFIKAKEKIAFDNDKSLKNKAAQNVRIINGYVKEIKKKIKKRVDIIFISNILEHMDSKEEAFKFLHDLRSILTIQGKLLIMQPDIKRIGNAYWDFFDHKIAITEKSLTEVLLALNYKIIYRKSPFLPYTTKTKFLPLNQLFLKIYLKVRLLQLIFGKQFFLIAQKN